MLCKTYIQTIKHVPSELCDQNTTAKGKSGKSAPSFGHSTAPRAQNKRKRKAEEEASKDASSKSKRQKNTESNSKLLEEDGFVENFV
mmetsp:Transcript_36498/g.36096  ORF Transcript_36498/g.36096 Transcript_36498/m.36096 type:complete len:87 (+) Transcript_36498:309-569(+)